MNITGIVVEYNPFHNGHLLHAKQSRKQTNADVIVAVMSGNFLQRGEPALVSKWARTKMALANGVDLVVELPYVYATQHAEMFAQGSISILNNIGATSVCFGSEAGEIEPFHSLVSFISNNKETYNTHVQEALKKGQSYPRALASAFKSLQTSDDLLDLSKPNNILGYHYVKAIYQQRAKLKPFTIQRTSAQYHDKEIPIGEIASATSIREALVKQKNDLTSIQHVVPAITFEQLQSYYEEYTGFHHWERLFPFLKYRILTTSKQQLQTLYEAEEGLENRLIRSIKEATSFREFMEILKTKRYTWTRLQRLCLHTLTNTTKDEMSNIPKKCPYIRILGMNEKGRSYINDYKKELNVPLISTISKFHHPFIEIEKKATSCYALGFHPTIQNKIIAEEYANPPIIV